MDFERIASNPRRPFQKGVKIVGSDVVEFTSVYDNSAETTAIAVTEIIYEILQWMVRVPVSRP